MANEVIPGKNGRKLVVQLDTILIEGVQSPGLRVQVKAKKTLKAEPNTCEVKVYNLSPDHRNALTKALRPGVTVSAGYDKQLTQIYYGQALYVRHERAGADIVTTVSTNDSGDKNQAARVHKSFKKGTQPGEVLKELAKALGVKIGNLNDAVKKLNTGKGASIYVAGCVMDGHAPHYLTALCRSAGLEWSVQDGTLQILNLGEALKARAIVLAEADLIGTPSITSKGVVEGVTFLQSDVLPGRQVQVKHPFVDATARLEDCAYTLDSYAEDWYVEFTAQTPKAKK